MNLTVESGQVFGFHGPNGAGKSTTIQLRLGMARPRPDRRRCAGSRAGMSRRRTGTSPMCPLSRPVAAADRPRDSTLLGAVWA
ncbi:ATP-binding cassette domain-containing protein [Pseudonocardia sp. RS010]|uniref:ATP-binding cassette domain-containing protein n=1 Tax=Pseudonocardia sp. RS010 TaxID=3385979 RepID=UPI0039A2E5E8